MKPLWVLALAYAVGCGGSSGGVGLTTPRPTNPAPATSITARQAPTPSPLCPGAPNQRSGKATIELAKGGTIVIQLRPDKAPKTVSIFAAKANTGFYDGLTFHRVVPGFVIQGGDPLGNGTGGGTQCTELSDLPFTKGAVGIARGQDINISNDSQFYICIGQCRNLDGMYTNFGQVISGQDVADGVQVGDKIKTIKVE